MESDRFDALATRLADRLSRRRSLALLAALGATATLAVDTEGKRKKRKRKKPKTTPPCGGGCGVCKTCSGNTCAPVANGTACGSGTCVNGTCITCTNGQVLIDNVCARPCTTTQADCLDESFCVNLAADSPDPQPDPRKICILAEGAVLRPSCAPSGRTDACPAGRICTRVQGYSLCAEPGR